MTDSPDLPVFDADHLKAMTSGDAGVAAEVLDIFREQAAMWGRMLDPNAPPEQWADAAHTLKGAALGVGAMRLATACEQAERLGRSGNASLAGAALAIGEVRDAMSAAEEAVARAAHELAVSGRFIASKDLNS